MQVEIIVKVKSQYIMEADDGIRKIAAGDFADFVHAVIDGIAMRKSQGSRLLQAVAMEKIGAQRVKKMSMMGFIVVLQGPQLFIAHCSEQLLVGNVKEQAVSAEFIKTQVTLLLEPGHSGCRAGFGIGERKLLPACVNAAFAAGSRKCVRIQQLFELNVMEPVMAFNLFNSMNYMTEAVNTFREKVLEGLEVNRRQCAEWVRHSVGVVTALLPHIGYENSARLARRLIRPAAPSRKSGEEGLLSAFRLHSILSPEHMTTPGIAS